MLLDEPAHGGAQAFPVRRGRRLRGRDGSCRGGVGSDRRLRIGRRDDAGINPGEHFLAQGRLAGLFEHLCEHSGLGRRHFEHHLVGFEFDQDLVLLDRIAGLLSPVQQRGVGDGLREHRYLHVDGHWGISSDCAMDLVQEGCRDKFRYRVRLLQVDT